MELQELLLTLVQTGLFGSFGFPLFNYLESKWPWLQNDAEFWMKRAIAWALTCVLSWLPYLAAMGMLYVPTPTTWREWIERLAAVAFIPLGITQGWHAVAKSKQG
jgi:hypothetical protein